MTGASAMTIQDEDNMPQAEAPPPSPGKPRATVTIKKYANRRLYNTATSSYVTLDNLAAMVKEGTEFNVYDAKSGEDLTRAVLTQIIVEEEGKSGQNLLPVNFLRQLIGFYGNNMQWLVPKYLDFSMQSLTANQEKFRTAMQNAFGGMGGVFPFGALEEIGKQNMAMFEKTLQMFSPFTEGAKQAQQLIKDSADQSLQTLQTQLANMQKQLAEMKDKKPS